MKILVIGSGGREHAICRAFRESKKTTKIFCADGNAGIAQLAECVPIKPEQINELADFAERNSIDLTFVGGETALALGIVDEFERRGLKIVGVSGRAARLESSKSFAKDFMARHKIPTARYFTAFSATEAVEILEGGEFGDASAPIVVKADGLAAGKGVVVAENRTQAIAAINDLQNLVGSEAAQKIVLEECLFGKEVSLLLFTDGKSFALMSPTRDHKRIGEGDTGANTGGMGTITDSGLLSEVQTAEIIKNVIEPTLKGAENDGFPVRGILFLGLMMTGEGAKVLEYNVRFGDPETQAILVRLKTDFVEICEAIISENLAGLEIEWQQGNSACIILAAKNYPQKPQTGDIISGLENFDQSSSVTVFHAGTAKNAAGEFITAGGRVLGVTATAENLNEALESAYTAVKKISWNGMQFRRDIGK